MTEVTLKFPYLDEPTNGIVLSGNSRGTLEKLINYSGYEVPVTLYPSQAELQYALGSTVRYVTVDPVFQIGEISGFEPNSGKIYVKVKDDNNVSVVKAGKVLPRIMGQKVKEGSTIKLEISNLVCLDILQA